MEAMRTARLRLRRHKHWLQVIDDPVHNDILRDDNQGAVGVSKMDGGDKV